MGGQFVLLGSSPVPHIQVVFSFLVAEIYRYSTVLRKETDQTMPTHMQYRWNLFSTKKENRFYNRHMFQWNEIISVDPVLGKQNKKERQVAMLFIFLLFGLYLG